MNTPIRPAVLASGDYPFTPIEARYKLDQNEAAADFPAELKTLVIEQLMSSEWNRYPAFGARPLVSALAERESWPEEGITVTTGSNVLIALMIQLASFGGKVLTTKPNFALYGLDARLLESTLIELPLREDLSFDCPAMLKVIRESGDSPHARGGVIYLSRPHAPGGASCALSDIEQIAMAAGDWIVVVDEAYCQYDDDNALALARRFSNIVIFRTFSKAWGLAGMRLGYALGSADIIRHLQKLVPPFCIATPQLITALVALQHPEYMRKGVALAISERERVFASLLQHPDWRPYPSKANFILFKTPDAGAAYQQLLDGGVLTRRQDSNHGLAGCLRVSIGQPEANDAFLRAAGLTSGAAAILP